MLRHVVTDVEVDRDAHHGLELILELGDVEQGNLAGHCWRNGGEKIEITPFVIIASSGGAEKSGLNEAIGLDQTPNLPFLSSYRVSGPYTFLLEPQALIDAPGESAFWCPSFRSSSGSLDSV